MLRDNFIWVSKVTALHSLSLPLSMIGLEKSCHHKVAVLTISVWSHIMQSKSSPLLSFFRNDLQSSSLGLVIPIHTIFSELRKTLLPRESVDPRLVFVHRLIDLVLSSSSVRNIKEPG